MNGKTLLKLYNLNYRTIEVNLEGITPEQSFYQPHPGGNCINWVLGHIVANRNPIMRLIGEEPIWNEEEAGRYKRGSEPVTTVEETISLDRMLADLRSSQDKIISKLDQITTQEFEEELDDGTRYEQLAFLQFHEAYHAGQLGILRRLVGQPGAIE
jgi:hypothetical protein